MKRVDLCYHFSCNPSVFVVLSSACGFCLIVVLCGKQPKLSVTFFFDFFLTHFSINMNNACVTVDKGLGSMKHSPWLCWYHGYCIKP